MGGQIAQGPAAQSAELKRMVGFNLSLSGFTTTKMASAADTKELQEVATKASAAKERAIAFWDAKINEEDGSFEALFGDPSQTPCTPLYLKLLLSFTTISLPGWSSETFLGNY